MNVPSAAPSIAGVNISTPAPVSPVPGATLSAKDQPVTLVVQADKNVTIDFLMRLELLARDVGIHDAQLATRPRLGARPASDGAARP